MLYHIFAKTSKTRKDYWNPVPFRKIWATWEWQEKWHLHNPINLFISKKQNLSISISLCPSEDQKTAI